MPLRRAPIFSFSSCAGSALVRSATGGSRSGPRALRGTSFFRLRMRTMVELERIIWRTSKVFVFGNAYNVVLARKPVAPFDISC